MVIRRFVYNPGRSYRFCIRGVIDRIFFDKSMVFFFENRVHNFYLKLREKIIDSIFYGFFFFSSFYNFFFKEFYKINMYFLRRVVYLIFFFREIFFLSDFFFKWFFLKFYIMEFFFSGYFFFCIKILRFFFSYKLTFIYSNFVNFSYSTFLEFFVRKGLERYIIYRRRKNASVYFAFKDVRHFVISNIK